MNKPILIQGALELETEYIVKHLENQKKITINGYDFYRGTIDGVDIVVSTIKVGTVNSAVATILGINEFNPRMVINQGIAGGHPSDVHVGDIVICEYAVNMNSYMTSAQDENEGIHPEKWELLTFKGNNDIKFEKLPADADLVTQFKNILESKEKIHIGTIVSGDGWNQEVDRIKWFIEKLDSKCEDMETYSAYRVCNDNNIPVIGIRIASNSTINKEEYVPNIAIKMQEIIVDSIKYIQQNKTLH